MASRKQNEANRRNAQKSTGPRTEAGKQASRANALKHGLAALTVPLPHEDLTRYEEMRQSLIADYAPANLQELQLVDTITSAWWRMHRASRYEAGIVETHLKEMKRRHNADETPDPAIDDSGVAVAMANPDAGQAWNTLARYESRAQSAYFRAIESLRKMQNDRKREEEKAETPVESAALASLRQPAAVSGKSANQMWGRIENPAPASKMPAEVGGTAGPASEFCDPAPPAESLS